MITAYQNSDRFIQTMLCPLRFTERKKQFKENKGGNDKMCDLVENYAKEYAEKVAKQTEKENALKFFQNGADYKLVRASITSLSDEELQKIYQEAKA